MVNTISNPKETDEGNFVFEIFIFLAIINTLTQAELRL